jgi:hypothetical protein
MDKTTSRDVRWQLYLFHHLCRFVAGAGLHNDFQVI